jgi:thioesterase domain-containing protein
VIQRSDVAYLHAIEGAFEARAMAPSEGDWRRFLSMLDRWGRGRVRIRVEVRWGEAEAALLDADYVSLLSSPGP